MAANNVTLVKEVLAAISNVNSSGMDDLTRHLARLATESASTVQTSGHSGQSEKQQHLLNMLKEVKEAKRRQAREHKVMEGPRRGRRDVSAPAPHSHRDDQNYIQDVLPWCDEPKGGNTHRQYHGRGGYRSSQGQQSNDSSFVLVDREDCGAKDESDWQGGAASGQSGWQGGAARGQPGWQGGPNGQPGWQGGVSGQPGWQGGASGQPGWQGGASGQPGWQGGASGQQGWQGGASGQPGWQGGVQGDSHHFQNSGPPYYRGGGYEQNQRGQKPMGSYHGFNRGAQSQPNHPQQGQGSINTRGQYHGRGRGRGRGNFASRNRNFNAGSLQNVAAEQDGIDVTVRLNTQKQTFKSNTDNMSHQFSPEEIIALKNALKKDQIAGSKTQPKKNKKTKTTVSKPEKEVVSTSDSEDSSEDAEPVKPVPEPEKKPAAKKKTKKASKKSAASSSGDAHVGVTNTNSAGGAAQPASNFAEEFQLYLGSNFDHSALQKLKKDHELKNMMLVAKAGDKIISSQPHTVEELVEFKKKYPNAEVIIIK